MVTSLSPRAGSGYCDAYPRETVVCHPELPPEPRRGDTTTPARTVVCRPFGAQDHMRASSTGSRPWLLLCGPCRGSRQGARHADTPRGNTNPTSGPDRETNRPASTGPQPSRVCGTALGPVPLRPFGLFLTALMPCHGAGSRQSPPSCHRAGPCTLNTYRRQFALWALAPFTPSAPPPALPHTARRAKASGPRIGKYSSGSPGTYSYNRAGRRDVCGDDQ